MSAAATEAEIVRQAIGAFPPATGVEVRDIKYSERGDSFDGVVEFARDGKTHRWVFETKRRIRPGLVPLLDDMKRRLAPEHPLLLVTDHVTQGVAEQLQAAGIDFLDSAGNVSLTSPDWYIWVTGNRRPAGAAPKRGLGPAVWKVAYAILREPSSASLPVRQLGRRAGISAGAVSTSLRSLEARGWIRRMGRSGTVATDLGALHNAWELGYMDRLRRRQHIIQARPVDQSLHEWCESLLSSAVPGVLLGGELAADAARLGVVAATGSLHVDSWGAQVMEAVRLIPSETGPISVLRTFGTCNHAESWPGCADPLLVRAELLSIQDERLDAVRARLHDLISARW